MPSLLQHLILDYNVLMLKKYEPLVTRIPVFGVSNQVPHKPGCTTTVKCNRLEILDSRSIGGVLL